MIVAEDIGLASRPCLRDTVLLVPVQEEAVLFDQTNGALHRLDPVAAVVCSCLDGEATLTEIIDDLSAGFGTDRDTVSRDVLRLTRRLGRIGVLEGVAGIEVASEDVDAGC
jgi:hypothetical protein